MTAVVFDYDTWALRYPELAATVPAPLAAIYFSEAELYLDNTGCNPVQVPYQPDATPPILTRAAFLNMITAHIAALNGPTSNPLVGRIESAAEGTVNVTAKLEGELASRAFWSQTKYGLAYWQASAQYRTMRYVPGPQFGQPPYLPYGSGVTWRR